VAQTSCISTVERLLVRCVQNTPTQQNRQSLRAEQYTQAPSVKLASASIKSEVADRFESSEAKMKLLDYIEVFYNQRRRHSTLGQISPARLRTTSDSRRVAK